MYLEQIEIHGFKSFGDPVKLKIPKGITGVIGPNGSGKSNVSDAIRWVLGEQSAKSLRGSKMEDIIFAGTEKRKSLGYAEVALTIKNPEEKVRIAYSEIVVKRRVYRSGESEYFINGSSCRLKDVQELFMDTGIGKDGYSIIGQGQIDRVLSSKPEERRTLFEEAAGIYKYKVRRIEAEKKLEKERENLIRIQDILSEIESRLMPLEEEAEKTKRFLTLKEKLKEIDVNIFLHDMDAIEIQLKQVETYMQDLDDEMSKVQLNQEKNKEAQSSYKRQKDELYKSVENLIEYFSQKDKEKEKYKGQMTLNEEKMHHLDSLLERLKEEQDQQTSDQASKKQKLSLLETKKVALEIEKASKEDIIKQDQQHLDTMEKELKSVEAHIDLSKKDLYQKTRDIDLYEAEIQKNEGVEAQLDYRYEQIKEQIALLNSEIQHQEVSLRLLDKNQSDRLEQIKENATHLEHLQKQVEETNYKQMACKKSYDECIQNKIQSERQLKWLEQLKAQHDGYYGSVKQVLKIVKAEPQNGQGIIGVIGELLDVPKAYEIAISTALGGALQNIVTLTEEDAKRMIRLMKERGIGRVTFLPQDTVRPAHPINEPQLEKEEGFLGFGNQLIKYDKAYFNIVSSLLGRILIIKDMNAASRIARKYQYKYKLVTLEGEVFNSGGSLSGGSSKQMNNVFTRAREVKELKLHIEKMIQKEEQQKETLKAFNEASDEQNRQFTQLNEAKQRLEHQMRTDELEYDKVSHALKLTKDNQLQLINERSNIEESLEKLQGGKEEVQEKLKELKNSLNQNETSIQALEEKLLNQKKEKELFANTLTEKRISLSQTEQNLNYLIEQAEELRELAKHFDEKSRHFVETKKNYQQEKAHLLEEIQNLKQLVKACEEEMAKTQDERNSYEAEKVALEQKETQLSKEAIVINDRLDHLKEEKYRLETKKEKMIGQKQTWGSNMWEQYELTYNHALEYKKENVSIETYRKQAIELKSQIKEIGQVNANAIEEYKETQNRYSFLEAQKVDIEKAEQALLEMIEQLTAQMKDIFTTQFKVIAENFSHVFKELFGGGEAYLQLLDEEHILESGIEIIAKPPGKKLQNMNLLSGGERTLTAISLVFGILKLKPSPFCILDEIEAALDDANVLRFADYLDKLSDETQFIVITHRKGTMERAHTLYGVTMQERGVSTILSIQLEDAQKYIEEKKTS